MILERLLTSPSPSPQIKEEKYVKIYIDTCDFIGQLTPDWTFGFKTDWSLGLGLVLVGRLLVLDNFF